MRAHTHTTLLFPCVLLILPSLCFFLTLTIVTDTASSSFPFPYFNPSIPSTDRVVLSTFCLSSTLSFCIALLQFSMNPFSLTAMCKPLPLPASFLSSVSIHYPGDGHLSLPSQTLIHVLIFFVVVVFSWKTHKKPQTDNFIIEARTCPEEIFFLPELPAGEIRGRSRGK